jgi:hypothetical protein
VVVFLQDKLHSNKLKPNPPKRSLCKMDEPNIGNTPIEEKEEQLEWSTGPPPDDAEVIDIMPDEALTFVQPTDNLEEQALFKAEEEEFHRVVQQCASFINGSKELAHDIAGLEDGTVQRGAIVLQFLNIEHLKTVTSQLHACYVKVAQKARAKNEERVTILPYKKLKSILIRDHAKFVPAVELEQLNMLRNGEDTFTRRLSCLARSLDPRWRMIVNIEAFPTSVSAERYGLFIHSMVHPIFDEALIHSKRNIACGYCRQRRNATEACSKCHMVYYCNVECQKQDWSEHKHVCKIIVYE